MRKLVAILDDVVNTFPPEDLACCFGLSHAEDVREQIVENLEKENKTTTEDLGVFMGRQLGSMGLQQVLRRLGIPFERGADPQHLVKIWFRHHELSVATPEVRPQELADTIGELANQVRAMPDKLDRTEPILRRCELLMRYLGVFYDLELAPRRPAAMEQLGLGELCELIATGASIKMEPYKATSTRMVHLADGRVKEILSKLPSLAGDAPAEARGLRAREVSECVIDLLAEWRGQNDSGVIPKGAVVVGAPESDLTTRAICYDEFCRRVRLTGIMTSVGDGDHVLLANLDEEHVIAPKLRPVPKGAAWTTPARAAAGLPAKAEAGLQQTDEFALSRQRNRIFLSYAHEDKAWVERVKAHLAFLQNSGVINVWEDSQIPAGDDWEEQIRINLGSTGVAILLVSADFLASPFIIGTELPVLLGAAREGKVKLLPLVVRPVLLSEELAAIQAVNNPEQPLLDLNEADREHVLANLARIVNDYCGGSSKKPPQVLPRAAGQ